MKQILTNEQVEILKEIGTCVINSFSNKGKTDNIICRLSKINNNQIILPMIIPTGKTEAFKNNIINNSNIFLNFYRINHEDAEINTQYKITATAQIETSGSLFEEIKHYEETEVLSEGFGFCVAGIIIANLEKIEEYVG